MLSTAVYLCSFSETLTSHVALLLAAAVVSLSVVPITQACHQCHTLSPALQFPAPSPPAGQPMQAPPAPPAPPLPPCSLNPVSLCPVPNATYYSFFSKVRLPLRCMAFPQLVLPQVGQQLQALQRCFFSVQALPQLGQQQALQKGAACLCRLLCSTRRSSAPLQSLCCFELSLLCALGSRASS